LRAEKEMLWNTSSIPSPTSRKAGFYYGHPQNRFWRIMGDLFSEDTPATREERIEFCHRHHIALWDVLKSCDIAGADDSSIRNPIVQPIGALFKLAPIAAVFATGQKAGDLYRKHVLPATGIAAKVLPSTSPANRRYPYEVLIKAYGSILCFCEDSVPIPGHKGSVV
jgi:hypoxanthine-DNA glycosylase